MRGRRTPGGAHPPARCRRLRPGPRRTRPQDGSGPCAARRPPPACGAWTRPSADASGGRLGHRPVGKWGRSRAPRGTGDRDRAPRQKGGDRSSPRLEGCLGRTPGAREANPHLPAPLDAVVQGERVTIPRHGGSVATRTPFQVDGRPASDLAISALRRLRQGIRVGGQSLGEVVADGPVGHGPPSPWRGAAKTGSAPGPTERTWEAVMDGARTYRPSSYDASPWSSHAA